MSKIVSISYLGIHPVFNITVARHHNYVTAGGTVLHNCDALRYFCVSRSLPGEPEKAAPEPDEDFVTNKTDYDSAMTGGEADEAYLLY